jgi:hypothetical protein
VAKEQPFDIRTNLPAVLDDLKAVDKALVTGLRKSMKKAGDAIVDRQREILATENPGTLTKREYTKAQPTRRGGYRRGALAKALAGARLARVEGAESTGRSKNQTRQAIADGLKMKVPTGNSKRLNLKVATTSGSPSKAFNQKIIKHRVFGTDVWASQKGLEYFSRGVAIGGVEARDRLEQVIKDAQQVVRTNPPIS